MKLLEHKVLEKPEAPPSSSEPMITLVLGPNRP